jgi:DNA-binding transcriptional LysR family regulator
MLNLKLIQVAEALYRTGNVTRAARELQLSQSAVSHALGKLREHFGDPLFVRVPEGVTPTATARGLRAQVEALAESARALSQPRRPFEPAKARGRFTLATTDYVEALLVPRLLPRLRREAPGIQLSIRPTGGELPRAELASGAFDAACAGFYRAVPEGFLQTKLFEDDFAVGCREGHPLASGPLTRARYLAAEHALITLQGDLQHERRQVVYGSYSFTGMAWSLVSADLLLTAPRRLLEAYRERFPIRILESPVERPRLQIRMVWHALTHQEPLQKWVRQLIENSVRDPAR